jgi:hypothetical protein
MSRNYEIRVGIVTENHFPRLGGMEYCTYFLARALNLLPDTFASVACSDMPEVPSRFPYPYKVYMAKSFSLWIELDCPSKFEPPAMQALMCYTYLRNPLREIAESHPEERDR